LKAQRDEFLDKLFEEAVNDSSIILISVDMGAPALDRWRSDLPNQFFSAGISEQNAINVASGLASQNKKVFVYMMACWVARCFEQIRYSCAMSGNKITIIGNGVGLGYAPAGPAHEPTEDIAYMRSLLGLEIISPASALQIPSLVDYLLNEPRLTYVRLERNVPELIDKIVAGKGPLFLSNFRANPYVFHKSIESRKSNVTIFSSGYMLDRSVECADKLSGESLNAQVIDVCKVTSLNTEDFENLIVDTDYVVTIEEQTIAGGFGSAILEVLSEIKQVPVLRIGIDNRYIFENGTRESLLNENGLSIETISNRINAFTQSL
jgi:transketolase